MLEQGIAVTVFNTASSEKAKIYIFTHHPSFYDSINSELLKWLNDNWEKWGESGPGWFTADAIATVPPDMLPVRVLIDMGGLQGRKAILVKMQARRNKKGGEGQT